MAAYLTVERFKLLSAIPSAFVDQVELAAPGYTLAQLEYWSAWIDSKLRKRYAAPFLAPVAPAVEGWLSRIVTPAVWTKRGVNATDEQWQYVAAEAEAARKEIEEAANSETGLFDLPLRGNTTDSGIVRGVPFSYSEASPYVSQSLQAQRGRQEDEGGSGTGIV
jgi:hypothetical protein